MSRKELAKRYLCFLIGLFVNSFGVSFVTKANLGTSPISSIPYTLSLGFAPTLGAFTLYMSIILIIIQLILLRKDFPKQYFLQIPVSLLFSYFIDLTMRLLDHMNPQSYPMQMISLLFGCAILGAGVYMEVIANVVMLPGESFVNAVSKTFHTDFGKTKVVFDSSMTIIAAVIGLVLYHKLAGVREGTIIAALLVGMIARFLKRKIGFLEKRLFMNQVAGNQTTGPKDKGIAEKNQDRIVITVSREYGSGGRKIAEKIAKELGLAFHDNDIMQLAAKAIGLTETVAANEEQKITNQLLYDMVAQIYDQSEQNTIQDQLYKAESEIIEKFAQEGNCVIVGRCADTLCDHVAKAFHIFLYADEEHKAREIMKRENIDFEKAVKHVKEINHKRANHYKYYTNRIWGTAENYTLCVDTGVVDSDTIVKLVQMILA